MNDSTPPTVTPMLTREEVHRLLDTGEELRVVSSVPLAVLAAPCEHMDWNKHVLSQLIPGDLGRHCIMRPSAIRVVGHVPGEKGPTWSGEVLIEQTATFTDDISVLCTNCHGEGRGCDAEGHAHGG